MNQIISQRHALHGCPPQSPLRQRMGAIIVHGFTSNHQSMAPLTKLAHDMGMLTETPLLRGHGGHYRDLRGTRWQHWLEDIATARERLRQRGGDGLRTVLIGFSLGGLLALASAAHDPRDLAAIVALAPALRIAHPLAPIAWMARGWMPFVPMGKAVAYSDPRLALDDASYSRLAIDAFCSFYRATAEVTQLLPQVTAPLLLMHSRRDRVIRPEAAQLAYDRVRSVDKELVWLERSGHVLLSDCEGATVLDGVERFLRRLS